MSPTKSQAAPPRRVAAASRTVAIAGLGAVGLTVARRLDAGIPGLRLVAVSAKNAARATGVMSEFQHPVPVKDPGGLADLADIVVEGPSGPGR